MDNNEDLAASIAKSIVSVVSTNEDVFQKALSISNAADGVDLTASIISSVLLFSAGRMSSNSNKRISTQADSSLVKEFSSSEFSCAEFSDDQNECFDSSGVFSGNPSATSQEFSQESDYDDFIPNCLQMKAASSLPFGCDAERHNEVQDEFSHDSDFYSQELHTNHTQSQQNSEFSQDSDIGSHEVEQVQPKRTQHQTNAEFSQDSDYDAQDPPPSYDRANQNAEFSQDSDYDSQNQLPNYKFLNQIAEFSQDSEDGLEQMPVNSTGPLRMMALAENEEFSQDSDIEPQGRLNEIRHNALAPQMYETNCFLHELNGAQPMMPFDEFSQDEE